jgi:hypothetical protein
MLAFSVLLIAAPQLGDGSSHSLGRSRQGLRSISRAAAVRIANDILDARRPGANLAKVERSREIQENLRGQGKVMPKSHWLADLY